MSNALSPELVAQMFAQESKDPFLCLVTLSHPSFSTIYLVNNSENITSNGTLFNAFPFSLRLPVDDGESVKSFAIEFDNVSLELITAIRTVTDAIGVNIKMILASMPDQIQLEFDELKIQNVTYDKQRISATIVMDNFLNTLMTSERYTPINFPGLF